MNSQNQDILFTTPRLILREYVESDFDGTHAYAKDAETVRFMTWGPNTSEDTHNFIQLAISQQTNEPRLTYHLVVVIMESAQIIGGCGINIHRPEHKNAEIGYCFNKEFWGRKA